MSPAVSRRPEKALVQPARTWHHRCRFKQPCRRAPGRAGSGRGGGPGRSQAPMDLPMGATPWNRCSRLPTPPEAMTGTGTRSETARVSSRGIPVGPVRAAFSRLSIHVAAGGCPKHPPACLRYTPSMSPTDPPDAQARRRARAAWPVVVRRLDDASDDDLSAVTDPAQRIRMMWPLAVEAWRLAGRPLPSYTRANTPSRVFRAGEPRPGDDESG